MRTKLIQVALTRRLQNQQEAYLAFIQTHYDPQTFNYKKIKLIKDLDDLELAYRLLIHKGTRRSTVLFGSARTSADSIEYHQTLQFSYMLGRNCIGITTGGGPGLMQAANQGMYFANKKNKAEGVGAEVNFGLNVILPHEQYLNPFVPPAEGQTFEGFDPRIFGFLRINDSGFTHNPGGWGTSEEYGEVKHNMIMGQILPSSLVFVSPQDDYWESSSNGPRHLQMLVDRHLISPESKNLIQIHHHWKSAIQDILSTSRNIAEIKYENREKNHIQITLDTLLTNEGIQHLQTQFQEIFGKMGLMIFDNASGKIRLRNVPQQSFEPLHRFITMINQLPDHLIMGHTTPQLEDRTNELQTEMLQTKIHLVNDRLNESKVFSNHQYESAIAVLGSIEEPDYLEMGRDIASSLAARQYGVITTGDSQLSLTIQQAVEESHDPYHVNVRLGGPASEEPLSPYSLSYLEDFDMMAGMMHLPKGYMVLPGGFETEALLEGIKSHIQNGKVPLVPIILINKTGDNFWDSSSNGEQHLNMLVSRYISDSDKLLIQHAHSVEQAMRLLDQFYKNIDRIEYSENKTITLFLKEKLSESTLRLLEIFCTNHSGQFGHHIRLEQKVDPNTQENLLQISQYNQKQYGNFIRFINQLNRLVDQGKNPPLLKEAA